MTYDDSYFCIAFGNKLRDLRRSRNFTRHDLAKDLGIDRDFVNSLELGVTGILTDGLFHAIAQLFNFDDSCLRVDVELSAQVLFLSECLENYFDTDDIRDRILKCCKVFSMAIQSGYRCAVADMVSRVSDEYQCCDTMLPHRLERQASVPVERELFVLKQVCDCFNTENLPVVKSAGGRQDDRDEFNLDEIVESVVVDHAVCFGEDAFVYVDDDYFTY